MAICPYCGSQIGDEASICGFCGANVSAEAAEAIAREIPEAEPIIEAAASIPDAPAEDEFEGIPDDILGSVLGALPGRQAAPKEETIPAVPENGVLPEIPSIDDILDLPEIKEVPEVPAAAEIPAIPAVEEAIDVPAAAEIPAVEEAIEAPAAVEIPTRPAAEEGYEAPVVEGISEIPVVEEANAVSEEQPVYAKPVENKPAPKWLFPAAILAVLAMIGIVFFAARGGTRAAGKDSTLGVYRATLVEMYGIQLDPDDIYEQGFSIELKDKGVCEINADGEKGKGNWSIEGDLVTIDDGHSTITGKLSGDVLKLENMLDMGLDMTLEKQE